MSVSSSLNADLGADCAAVNRAIAEFARAMCESTSYYNDSRGARRAIDNIMLGKKGEVLACLALKRSLEDVCAPDFSVLDVEKKSWDADLRVGGVPLHVKTCSSYTESLVGDRSWTFQKADRIFRDGGYVILVYCRAWHSSAGWVSRVYDFKTEIEPLLADPKIERYRGSKLCLNQKALC